MLEELILSILSDSYAFDSDLLFIIGNLTEVVDISFGKEWIRYFSEDFSVFVEFLIVPKFLLILTTRTRTINIQFFIKFFFERYFV